MFEKKIIIGSVLGFIASAIGVIAVFFPDLLNLQKKRMKSIEVVVRSNNDFERLKKELEATEVDEIIKINALLCAEEQYSSEEKKYKNIPQASNFEIPTSLEKSKEFLEVRYKVDGENKYHTFNFPSSIIESTLMIDDPVGVECVGYTISGYVMLNGVVIDDFMHIKYDNQPPIYQNYEFEEIKKSQIKIKDY